MTTELARLQFHMPGLLELLGRSLYSDPRVAYRELIQNAHDSCVRRRLVCDGLATGGCSIRIATRREGGRRYVDIVDDGEGLDADDIRSFLATIGRGRTAELRAALEERGADAAHELIGQFGVGLLSAFLVADRVTVTTRRHDVDDGAGYRWICEGQQTYRLEPRAVANPGTRVTLRIRAGAQELGHPAVVRDAARRYARFLDVPIHVDGDAEPLNARTLPWAPSPGRPAWGAEELATELAGGHPPLATIALRAFDHPTRGRVRLDGLLCIPRASSVSVHEFGEVAVLVRRMSITARERDLLPAWARFATGIVDCPILSPTASREQVRHDEVFDAVREAIGAQLLDGLRDLQRARPATWRAFLAGHGPLLKRWAVAAPALFETIADEIPFRTSRGDMTLPAYLEHTGGVLYFFTDEQQARTMALLLESATRPVIDAQYVGEEPFLRMYAETRGARLVRELGTAAGVLEPCRDVPAPLAALARAMRRPDADVVVSRFRPTTIPAVLVVPEHVVVCRRARDALDAGRIAGPMRALVRDYLDASPGAAGKAIHLNADCPLIARLAGRDDDDARRAATVVGEIARLITGERLSPAELVASVARATAALEDMLQAGEPRAEP